MAGAVVLLALAMSAASLVAAAPSFPDVPGAHPYYLAIADLAARGVVEGYDDGTYGPGDPVSRQQFAKLAVLAGGYAVTEDDVCPFADVQKSDGSTFYPDNYVAVAAAKGITEGATATTFDPYGGISRYQATSMAVRMADGLHPGLLAAPPAGWAGTGGWGGDPTHGANARRAEYNGLLAGFDPAALNAYGNMTRGEVAQLLYNLLGALAPPATTSSTTGTTPSTGAGTSTTTAPAGDSGAVESATPPSQPTNTGWSIVSIVLEQKQTDAQSALDQGWWNQAYGTPMQVGTGGDPFGGTLDMRGRVLDNWERPLYVDDLIPTVPVNESQASYKIVAQAVVGGANFAKVWTISGGYRADSVGWIEDTFSGMPAVTVTFTAWLDTDGDNVIDPGELQSNKVRTTFLLGPGGP